MLHVPYIAYNSEVTVVCASMVGAGLGFLWFNAHPAQVFMGDVGALALGGMLGTMAVMTVKKLRLRLWAFVAEAVSVMLQVARSKLRKKRIFLMAPLHHHFEELGWKNMVRTVLDHRYFGGVGLNDVEVALRYPCL